jgi:probable dihydroxyacetone kinase regulator
MAQITKRMLAESFKKIMERKPLTKITVSDIAKECGVNRATFYYHFKDLYDLIEWLIMEGMQEFFDERPVYDTWEEEFLQIFHMFEKNKKLMLNAYRNGRREQVEYYLNKLMFQLIYEMLNDYDVEHEISEKNKVLIADLFKYALGGVVLKWAKNDMKDDPVQIVKNVSSIISGSVIFSAEQIRKQNENIA